MQDEMNLRSMSYDRLLEQDVFSDPSEILKKLLESQFQKTVIGIISPVFGRVMVLTSVETLLLEESTTVVLKPYDIYGSILPANKLLLEDITSVRPFSSLFRNPLESKISDDQPPSLRNINPPQQ